MSYYKAEPSNYVAGLGRGAIGFTTRSDIGPARTQEREGSLQDATTLAAKQSALMAATAAKTNYGQAPAGYIAGAGRGSGGFGEAKPSAASINTDRGDYSETQFDEFAGFQGSLFSSSTQYDDEDRKADAVWDAIDERMEGDRKRKREAMLKKKLKSTANISDQFSDLKQNLKTVSMAEWDAIPDAYSGVKHRKQEHYTPVTDRLLAGASEKLKDSKVTAIDVGNDSVNGGQTNLAGLSAARDQMLRFKLDKMSDSVTGQTVVDPKGYLTDLNSVKVTSSSEIGDIKKARLLLSSVTSTNPKHGPGWIAAARLEEVAGKLQQARNIIKQGCKACPESEDVWLESARLNNPDNAKVILAVAVRHIPNSVKIWLAAAELEGTGDSQISVMKRKAVLRRALEIIPNSIKLWKAAVELETNDDDAKIMLARATECVPHSLDLWLALARLEKYQNAKIILNKARLAIPQEPKIWIAACQLEEANNATANIDNIFAKALSALAANHVVIDRETWLKHAKEAEDAESFLTCGAIIRSTVHIGVEDKKRTFKDDAMQCIASGHIVCARSIYAYALSVFPTKKSVWLAAIAFEKKHGTVEQLHTTLKNSVERCPGAEILWLMYAKETWIQGNVPQARGILKQAFQAKHNSEAVWLAAVKLEWENDEIDRARALLERARSTCPTQRVWLKSALLEYETDNFAKEQELLMEALKIYPNFDKLWMMLGQKYSDADKSYSEARKTYVKALDICPASIPLWIMASRLEEKVTSLVKARSILEVGRLKNRKEPLLWLESIKLERRSNELSLAKSLMAKALQECPKSGILWAEQISMLPRPQQKSKAQDALKKCDDDVYLVTGIACLFWRDGKQKLARKWFHRAVTLDPDLGDAWGNYYMFELQHGTKEQAEDILNKCVNADPKHGLMWCEISKKKENRRLKTDKILKLLAATIAKPE